VSSKIPPKFLEDLGLSGHEKNGHEKNGHDALGERVLLAEAIKMGVDPPDELEPDVLIRGAVHWVYAPAASGKTWLALWLIKRCLDRGQRVVYFDSENGRRITAERLALLGVDAARVDELLQYRPFPTLDTQSAETYAELLDSFEPELVVFDSLANFLGSAGLEESVNDDLIRWAAMFTRPARARGVTTVVLDHTGHDGDHARGASRKRDEADVMWKVGVPVPFDRDSVGRIVLRRDKDREAWLPERVGFSVGGSPEGFLFRHSEGTVEEPDPQTGLTKRDRSVLGVLRDAFGPEGATAAEWQRACLKPPLRVSSASFYRSLRALKSLSAVIAADSGRDSNYRSADSGADSGSGEKPDSEGNGIGKGETGYYQSLSDHYHDSGDSEDQSAHYQHFPPPFRGDSADSDGREGDDDPLRAFFGSPPEWAIRQARHVRGDEGMLSVLCFAVAGHVAAGLDETPAGGVKGYAERIGPLVAAWVEEQAKGG